MSALPPSLPPPLAPAADPPPPHAWIILFILTSLSGLFSGLNLGLMSLTVEDLNIVINSSKDKQMVSHAKRILPLRVHGNLLLCTLLIGNTVVNVMLAVVTDPIWVYLFGSGLAGVILALAVPSAIIVVFGEIVPQSVCSRYALSIGAKTIWLTYIFVVLTFMVAYPISKLLDRLLGAEVSGVYTRQGLFQLIKLNAESAVHAKESGLTKEDAKILGGALTFQDRSVSDVMTPLSRCFSLPIDTILDRQAFLDILQKGHTRIPVYDGEMTNVVAVLLAKNLLGIGFERNLSLSSVLEGFRAGGGDFNAVRRVPLAMKCNVALEVSAPSKAHTPANLSLQPSSLALYALIQPDRNSRNRFSCDSFARKTTCTCSSSRRRERRRRLRAGVAHSAVLVLLLVSLRLKISSRRSCRMRLWMRPMYSSTTSHLEWIGTTSRRRRKQEAQQPAHRSRSSGLSSGSIRSSAMPPPCSGRLTTKPTGHTPRSGSARAYSRKRSVGVCARAQDGERERERGEL